MAEGNGHPPSELARQHDKLLPVLELRVKKLEDRVETVATNSHTARDIASQAVGENNILVDTVAQLRQDMRQARDKIDDLKKELKAEFKETFAALGERHDKTDDTLRWFGRLIIGAVVAALLGLVLLDRPALLEMIKAAKAASFG